MLAVSRAFGDVSFIDAGLMCEPEITRHVVTKKDSYLVLASDGVWDDLENDEVAAIVQTSVTSNQ